MKKLFYLLSVLLLFSCSATSKFQRNGRKGSAAHLESVARKWLNTPYRYGGDSHRGIDCSALAQKIYMEAYHYKLPRTSNEQYKQGKMVRLNWIKAGDLIFFKRSRTTSLDHVGVYLGQQKFIHASLHNGVVISELTSSYYRERIVGIRRYSVSGNK
jgi:cell wall-associated NlpC family hydrolase